MTARGFARLAALATWLLFCLPLWVVTRPFRGDGHITCLFLRGVGWLLGLRVRREGAALHENVLYVSNHISWLDIPALGGAERARFIAKSDIAGWPLIGKLAAMGGSVFVVRQRRSGAGEQAQAVQGALGEGRPVVLFAEGGTGDGATLTPFRPSLFAAANVAAVPVQPVAIDYGARSREIAWPDNSGFGAELKRMLNRPAPVPVTLRFLPALDGGSVDRKRLAAETQAAIATVLER